MKKVAIVIALALSLASNLNADTLRSFKAILIDRSTTASTVPIALANTRRFLLKTGEEFWVREPDGTIKALSLLTGVTRTPLDMNGRGEILFAPESRQDGCFVSIFNKNGELASVELPSDAPCNAQEGRLGKSEDFFALIVESTQDSIPRPQQLLLYRSGQFQSKQFLGDSPGLLDHAQTLAGFKGNDIVTNVVAGSTTPDIEKGVFSETEKFSAFSTSSTIPTPFSFLEITQFPNAANVLLHDDLNGCNTYVSTLAGRTLTNFKRIRKSGSCIYSCDINVNGDVSGLAFADNRTTLFLWNREKRFQNLAPLISPQINVTWSGERTVINDLGDIGATAETADSRTQAVLLIRRKA